MKLSTILCPFKIRIATKNRFRASNITYSYRVNVPIIFVGQYSLMKIYNLKHNIHY